MLLELKVKTINDEVHLIHVDHDMIISDVKTRVKVVTAIPEERQRLIFKGRVLQDEDTVEEYQIEDGQTIHMVARPSDYDELRSRTESSTEQSSASRDSTLQTLLALSALAGESGLGGSSSQRQSSLNVVSESESLEAIRQGLLTTHTLISSMDTGSSFEDFDNNDYKDVDFESKRAAAGLESRMFFIGQWLDVKDTVNQWLEATVMDINYEEKKMLIHYNGWPTRWDEWIDFKSDRVTAFRTRTANVTTGHASPMPSNSVSSAPETGPQDVRHVIPELQRLVNFMQPLLNEAAYLCTEDRMREKEQSSRKQNTDSDMKEDVIEGDSSIDVEYANMPWLPDRHNVSPHSLQQGVSRKDVGSAREREEADIPRQERLAQLTKDLSPLMDRLGRAMTDLAPHFMNLESTDERGTRHESRTSDNTDDHVLSPIERILESLSLGTSPLQHLNSSSERSYRPLVTAAGPSRRSGLSSLSGRGNHVDIRIHAILAPSRANTQMGNSSGGLSSSDSTSNSDSPSPSPTPPNDHPDSNRNEEPDVLSNAPHSRTDLSLAPGPSPPSGTQPPRPSDHSAPESHSSCVPPVAPASSARALGSTQAGKETADVRKEERKESHAAPYDRSGRIRREFPPNDEIEDMYNDHFGGRLSSRVLGSSSESPGRRSAGTTDHHLNHSQDDCHAWRSSQQLSKPPPEDMEMPNSYAQYARNTPSSSTGWSEATLEPTLADLEREMALFAEQTKSCREDSEENEKEDVVENNKRKKKKSLSFVQRMKRSLSFQQSSTSRKSKSQGK